MIDEPQRKKPFLKVLLVAIALTIAGMFAYQNTLGARAMPHLVKHLTALGHHAAVTQPVMTPEEKKVLDAFKVDIAKLQKLAGVKPPPTVDDQQLTIDGIDVKVTQYVHEPDAKKVFESEIGREMRSREADERNNTPHFRSDFFLNKTFVMRADYFSAHLVNRKVALGSEGQTDLHLDPGKVATIGKAFMSY